MYTLKIMKRYLLIFAISIIYASCSTEHKINNAEWLLGTWENITQQGSIYETWTRENDMEFKGISYTLQGKDTVVFETLRLLQEKNSLYYIPTVPDQNEGQPVRFLLKEISPAKMVFENPKHDFPQVISYTKINADSLVAAISGTSSGKEITRSFPMKRIK